jgi:hypothetical protein
LAAAADAQSSPAAVVISVANLALKFFPSFAFSTTLQRNAVRTAFHEADMLRWYEVDAVIF